MALEIMKDCRVRSVVWRDLTALSRWDVVSELIISLPWLIASLVLAGTGWIIPALLASFFFFLTGLRQSHGAQHYTLGISRRATEWVLFALSLLMLGSMHAVQITHLHHHRHCMGEDDVEAASARMRWWRAILIGPLFPILLHRKALQLAQPRQKRWIVAELIVGVAWVIVAAVIPVPVLVYHAIAMAAGQCLTSFFAVWTVHHDCDRSHFIARTSRGRWRNRMSYAMFFHMEHHLFPAVPTRRLARLAERLDQVAPELADKRVF